MSKQTVQRKVRHPHPSHAAAAEAPGDTRTQLAIASIDRNPWNTRRFARRLDAEDGALTESIRLHGVLEQLLVRPAAGDRYELVFGERRLRCAAAAGLTEVPVFIRTLDDQTARILTVTENLHQRRLPFLAEAEGIGQLFAEGRTAEQVAAELGKPRSWIARRRRLLNLTSEWRRLAEDPESFLRAWSPAHFEQVAMLEAPDQDDFLTRQTHRLEACASPADVARLTRELALDIRRFPWKLDDADLHPVAGACSACPLRSSHHPGLFDDQESLLGDDAQPGRASKRHPPGEPVDRCLSPSCAEKKRQLFVERRVAELAAKNPTVVKLQEHDTWRPLPGLVPAHRVQDATKRTPGAVPAVVADGPNAGKVRWVKPLQTPPTRSSVLTPAGGPQKVSLAARREQRLRRRKLHAIELLRPVIHEQAPPDVNVSLRLAIVFGTDRAHSHLGAWHDPLLDRFHGSPTSTSAAGGADHPDAETDAQGEATEGPDPTANPGAAGDESSAPPSEDPTGAERPAGTATSPGQRFWSAFEALGHRETEFARHLWERVLPVLLGRMTPDGDPRQADAAWVEAISVAALVGLNAQDYLDQATAALPDPKSWAAEEAALEKAAASSRTRSRKRAPASVTTADSSPSQLAAG